MVSVLGAGIVQLIPFFYIQGHVECGILLKHARRPKASVRLQMLTPDFFLLDSSSPQTDCKLRAELKRHYHGLREAISGQDIKYYWRSEAYMLKLVDKKPEIAVDRGLKQLCNKSTMLYWART